MPDDAALIRPTVWFCRVDKRSVIHRDFNEYLKNSLQDNDL
ncbi:hypothetical protein GBAG_2521 [Buttiauxella agrestis ATCC 33320]|uniref:Uncharacterized protein n=1 Tax=Buttiauxella agrestis ATCC 33320 TaxID=1006004 RepID=A0A085GBZ2_9ENTR|nr:hypothetical protein GBAG_2521 [Buttiauxella agrestis ATCC 33320]